MAFRYFEDFPLGEKVELGSHTVTEAEILAFAREWDPQRIHVDADFAARGAFGGIIASGWHTGGIFMRLFVDAVLRESSAIASPGVDELRWLQPVKPGDALRAEATVIEAISSRSRPDRGFVKHDCKVYNQRDELVMRLHALAFFARRPLHAATPTG
jgi:acyl dehydratase